MNLLQDNVSRDTLIRLIDPDPDQARKHFSVEAISELAQSMQENGQAVPILLRPNGDRFTIVHGERRWRAAQSLEWETIRAEVRDLSEEEARWLSLVENIQRADLTPSEEARAYQARIEEGLTQEQLGQRLGKTRTYIAQKLRLLTLPTPILFYLDSKAISEGHARQLLRFRDLYGDVQRTFPPIEPTEGQYTAEVALLLSAAIRPLDRPLTWGYQDPYPDDILEACKLFAKAIEGGITIPWWEVTAFWWASCVVMNRLSVVNLSHAIDTWYEAVLSALFFIHSRPKLPVSECDKMEWWGFRSDLRFSGMAALLDKPDQWMTKALENICVNGSYMLPSSLQADSAQKRTHNALVAELGGND